MNANNPQAISPQIFILAAILTLLWGTYFLYTLGEWRRINRAKVRADVLAAFRRVVVAWCAFILPCSVLVRTALVLAGVGDAVIGQILFFSLAGSNLVGGLFAVISLRYD